MADLFAPPPTYPDSVLLSIYNAYPRRTGRPAALKRIREALDRICQGEIDGAPRTQAEAIEFLRVKTEEARRQMGARLQKHIPHPATFYHQSRYLRPELATAVEQPKRLNECIEILAEYPTVLAPFDPENYMPALMAIDKALEVMELRLVNYDQHGRKIHAIRRLKARTELYAAAVKQWPVEDLKFVPSPVKFYSEARYDQPSESWERKPARSYIQEREQLARILEGRPQTGNSGGRAN